MLQRRPLKTNEEKGRGGSLNPEQRSLNPERPKPCELKGAYPEAFLAAAEVVGQATARASQRCHYGLGARV